MSATGRGVLRDPLDRYDTPAWPVDRLLDGLAEQVDLGRKLAFPWLEPAVGAGAITDAVDAWFSQRGSGRTPTWRKIDVRPRGALAHGGAERLNFLTSKRLELASNHVTITNPPYRKALAFAQRVVPVSNLTAMLLRLSWVEGASHTEPERAAFLRAHPPDLFVLPERPRFTRNGRPLRNADTGEPILGSDASAYAWCVWGLPRPTNVGRWRLLEGTPVEERRRAHG